MIQEAIIYSVAVLGSVYVFVGYLQKKAELDSEATIAKATAYANAQKAGYMAESAAMNFGNEGGSGGQMGITDIVNLISNPQIQALLQNLNKPK